MDGAVLFGFCLRAVRLVIGLRNFLVVDQRLDATLRQFGRYAAHADAKLLAANFKLVAVGVVIAARQS